MSEAQKREAMRLSLLRYAQAAGGNGMTAGLFLQYLANEGARATIQQLEDEIVYLVDKGFLAEVPKKVSPEVKAWRITASGRDFLAERGIES